MPEIINGRYQIQDVIGEGGMGVVFQALDRLTGQMVALKRVRLDHELGEKWGLAFALSFLGQAELWLNRFEDARLSFLKGVMIAQSNQLNGVTLHLICGFARLSLLEGDPKGAAELAGFAQYHDAYNRDIGLMLDPLWPQLDPQLTAEEKSMALERGQTLDLETLITQLNTRWREPIR